jgi:hypothetical protein
MEWGEALAASKDTDTIGLCKTKHTGPCCLARLHSCTNRTGAVPVAGTYPATVNVTVDRPQGRPSAAVTVLATLVVATLPQYVWASPMVLKIKATCGQEVG